MNRTVKELINNKKTLEKLEEKNKETKLQYNFLEMRSDKMHKEQRALRMKIDYDNRKVAALYNSIDELNIYRNYILKIRKDFSILKTMSKTIFLMLESGSIASIIPLFLINGYFLPLDIVLTIIALALPIVYVKISNAISWERNCFNWRNSLTVTEALIDKNNEELNEITAIIKYDEIVNDEFVQELNNIDSLLKNYGKEIAINEDEIKRIYYLVKELSFVSGKFNIKEYNINYNNNIKEMVYTLK